ncbi:hypothetical protein Pelo_19000 [Pelomyxa schiedti]|nr:hypothetical protein Pelo_19000 [Pelomyxa schiedti]
MYYFLLGNRACELKVLVLNTGEVVTLSEGSQSARKLIVEAVDETHLSLTKRGHNTVTQTSAKTSVYSLSELISSSTALPPPHSESSCFDQVTPIHVHHFSPGSLVSAVGCGIVTSSNLSMSSWHHSSEPKRPRLSNTRDRTISKRLSIPQFLMSHEFLDATTGTALFQVKQTDVQVALLPVDIHPVPFHNPFPLKQHMENYNSNYINFGVCNYVTVWATTPHDLGAMQSITGDKPHTVVGVSAEKQILQLIVAVAKATTPTIASRRRQSSPVAYPRDRRGRRCYAAALPLWVVVECVGKRWVMRPERRVMVTMEDTLGSTTGRRYFFAVSFTLGIVGVWMDDKCVGWLGGENFLRGDSERLRVNRVDPLKQGCERILSWKMTVRKVCCNQRWVVVAGTHNGESGLFLSTVENGLPQCWREPGKTGNEKRIWAGPAPGKWVGLPGSSRICWGNLLCKFLLTKS